LNIWYSRHVDRINKLRAEARKNNKKTWRIRLSGGSRPNFLSWHKVEPAEMEEYSISETAPISEAASRLF
jgi:hypothetical protein